MAVRLGPAWANRFDGMAVAAQTDGTTVLTGRLPDQAALHGILQTLRDTGIPLLSVTPLDAGPAASPVLPTEPKDRS